MTMTEPTGPFVKTQGKLEQPSLVLKNEVMMDGGANGTRTRDLFRDREAL